LSIIIVIVHVLFLIVGRPTACQIRDAIQHVSQIIDPFSIGAYAPKKAWPQAGD
jgi:hypothetical protein